MSISVDITYSLNCLWDLSGTHIYLIYVSPLDLQYYMYIFEWNIIFSFIHFSSLQNTHKGTVDMNGTTSLVDVWKKLYGFIHLNWFVGVNVKLNIFHKILNFLIKLIKGGMISDCLVSKKLDVLNLDIPFHLVWYCVICVEIVLK